MAALRCLFRRLLLRLPVALAVWIGVCVFGAAYYRNFQSYGFVLTGYGTAITATLDYIEAILYYDWCVVEASSGLGASQRYQLLGGVRVPHFISLGTEYVEDASLGAQFARARR